MPRVSVDRVMGHYATIKLLSLTLLAGFGCQSKPQGTVPSGPTVAAARAFTASQPRHLRGLPFTETPAGLADLSAETCGACHHAIYAEWKISTHARAWLDDAQFLAEVAKSEKQGVAWMCMNCHTPVQAQLPKLVAGLKDGKVNQPIFVDNPDFDAKLQKEAITCATCHVKDGTVLGPWGDSKAPHPVKKDETLRTEKVCTQCHQAAARFDTIGLACVFNTGIEYEQSPQAKEGKICQDCHMPVVERPLWVGGTEKRKTRRHWFGGSLIPKKPEYTEEMAALRAHYPPGLSVKFVTVPDVLKASAGGKVEVEIENAEAGHKLPTGDPERFIRVVIRATDAAGADLGETVEQIGIEYQWSPVVKLLSDNRLAPKEKRKLSLSFAAPAKGAVKVHVEASRWRISEENLEYHGLKGRYVPGQTFFEETRMIPVSATK